MQAAQVQDGPAQPLQQAHVREWSAHPLEHEHFVRSLLSLPGREHMVSMLSTWVIERARDGASVEELMVAGREVLRRDQVMDGVADMLADVQVEATFPDGRKLVTLHPPLA